MTDTVVVDYYIQITNGDILRMLEKCSSLTFSELDLAVRRVDADHEGTVTFVVGRTRL